MFLFSDDPDSAAVELKEHGLESIPVPNSFSPLDTMKLLALTDAKILSNSSFSWWAARIGAVQSPVVAPYPWFRRAKEAHDLVPSHWMRLNIETGQPIHDSSGTGVPNAPQEMPKQGSRD